VLCNPAKGLNAIPQSFPCNPASVFLAEKRYFTRRSATPFQNTFLRHFKIFSDKKHRFMLHNI
jgi:hypothetical protein